MSWIGPVLGIAASLLGGDKDQKTTTEVKRPVWQENAMQGAANALNNSPVAQLDPKRKP